MSENVTSRPSIAAIVPELPDEAMEFATEVGKLCEKYGIERVEMKVQIDNGFGTKHWNEKEYRSDVVSDMSINISKRDRRGRPRTQIYVQANLHVSVPIVWEKDSTN